LTTYAATKAGLAHLGEGIRAELLATPIKVSVLYPGYIRTEINAKAGKLPFEVDVETGCRALAKTIERAPAHACVPRWPWSMMGFLMRHLPLSWVLRITT
jgi:short-subunit dehydrogenase